MNRFVERASDFQIILVIEQEDGRLYPLTDTIPQCLLPICNQTWLRWQLNALEKAGAKGNGSAFKTSLYLILIILM